MTVEGMVLVAGVLLALGVVASRMADVMRTPALLLFLGLGMLAGSEGVGGIAFDSPDVAQAVGTLALIVILFTGGLETRWSQVRPVLLPGLTLATLGVVVTVVLLAGFAWYMLGSFSRIELGASGLSWLEAVLLAAIVSSTDAAAVFSVFRGGGSQPRARLRSTLELESGSNDPMAVLLTTLVLGLLVEGGGASSTSIALSVVLQFLGGGIVGASVGALAVLAVHRMRLSGPGLYPPLVLAFGLIAFGVAEAVGGNGFLSVFAAGLVIGNRIERQDEAIFRFHDSLTGVMQIGLFVVLGLLVFPSRLIGLAPEAIVIALFLVFVARPVAVFLCLSIFRLRRSEMAYVSWAGLRGSVPIVLATFPASYGLEASGEIFHLVFFVVLVSVTLQGSTLGLVGRRLKVVSEGQTETKT